MSRMGELNLVIRECLNMMTNEYFNGIDDITIKDINDFFKKLNSYKEYDTYKIVYYAIFSYPKNFALHPYREGVITYLNIASKEDILEQIYYVMDAIIKKEGIYMGVLKHNPKFKRDEYEPQYLPLN